MIIPWWDWIGKGADVLSVLTLAAAGSAWWQIRKVTGRYQALLRMSDQLADLKGVANELVQAAPFAESNPDPVLDSLSVAEGKLMSLKGWIRGRYIPKSSGRELVLEITEVRGELKGYQARGAYMDERTAREAYRKISQIAQRITDHAEDRRLER
jgi:hypothetical protein